MYTIRPRVSTVNKLTGPITVFDIIDEDGATEKTLYRKGIAATECRRMNAELHSQMG